VIPGIHVRTRGVVAAIVALLLACAAGLSDSVPFWGSRASEPIGTDPKSLKPGQFVWDAPAAPDGPIVVLVSLPEQRARVYRNGLEIGVAGVSTGRAGHLTPTGVFTILTKDKDHRSKTYNNAPMPYAERLTWDGVALHAGGLPGYPSSHGCVHLPSRFAELLYGISNLGMTVVIANDATAPKDVAHPAFLAPVSAVTGKDDEAARLAPGEVSRWEPEKSPTGPVTLVVSAADARIIVFRNGIEIGRARITIDDPGVAIGNSAFMLKSDPASPADGQSPAGLQWFSISLPGATAAGGAMMNPARADRVHVPPTFAAGIFAILTPGATLYVTDEAVLPTTTGPSLNVLNADPPPAP
jgi:hypothetical protein